MTETKMSTHLLRQDMTFCENMHDIDVVDREANYLADEARAEFAILEAEAGSFKCIQVALLSI